MFSLLGSSYFASIKVRLSNIVSTNSGRRSVVAAVSNIRLSSFLSAGRISQTALLGDKQLLPSCICHTQITTCNFQRAMNIKAILRVMCIL